MSHFESSKHLFRPFAKLIVTLNTKNSVDGNNTLDFHASYLNHNVKMSRLKCMTLLVDLLNF